MKKILIPTIILAIVLSTVASANTSGTQRQESNRNTSGNQRQETNRTTSNLKLPEESQNSNNKNTSGTQRQESNRDANNVNVSGTQLQTEKLKNPEITKANPVCAQTAIGKRDDTIINASQKYTTDWVTIINKRTASEKLAYLKNSEERIKEIRAANSIKSAEGEKVQKILTQSKKLAWDMFRLEIRACGFATNPL